MLFYSFRYAPAGILSGHFKDTLNGVSGQGAEQFKFWLSWGKVAKASDIRTANIVRMQGSNDVINNVINFKIFQSKELLFNHKTMGRNCPMLVLPILNKVLMFEVHL
jgi:hypothetical protein